MFPGRKTLILAAALAFGWVLWPIPGIVASAAKNPANVPGYIRWEAVNTSVGFPFCLGLFGLYAALQKRLEFRRLIELAPLLCYTFGFLWRGASWSMTYWLGMNPSGPTLSGLAIRGGLVDGVLLGFFSLLYFAIDHRWQFAEEKEKARQATALAHQAQLQMLRYQLNPHFLFNALNSIRAMIVEDAERSREMVTELSEFLRYSLDGDKRERTIGDEVQAIENYLSIQRIRFEERLDATVRVGAGASDFAVPCFLVHPLVENAVKYGIETSSVPLRVRIEIDRNGNELAIRVANTGRLLGQDKEPGSAPAGTGTGLKNIAQRLQLMYPDRHSFKVWEDDGWVRTEIVIRMDHAYAQSANR